MAVNVDFSGPVNVNDGSRIAGITGLGKSKFKIRISGQAGVGWTDIEFSLGYTVNGQSMGDTQTHVFRAVQAGDFEIVDEFNFAGYDDGSISIYGTTRARNSLIVTSVEIEDYIWYGGEEDSTSHPSADGMISGGGSADPSKRKGISFNIEKLVPRFILSDKNGWALAKAIERAFQLAAEGAQYGIGIIQDPYKMPEWRLDEMAGELGCLYDYNGSIEQKRYWILNATYLYTVYGTAQAIYNFLEGYFQTVQVEENWEYGGDPFHFRVTVSGGDYGADKIAWARKAIENVKNVRSVLDTVTIDNGAEIIVEADFDWYHMPYFFNKDEVSTGNGIETWDEEATFTPARADVDKTDVGVTG